MLLFATLFTILFPIIIESVGFISLLKYPTRYLCIHRLDNKIYINDASSSDCIRLEINVHKFQNNIVINFLSNKRICRFLCINKCGDVYHDSVYHTDDCKLTTAAFDDIETLSVHRGNYSDFVATHDFYNFVPLSFKEGDSIEREYDGVALKYVSTDNRKTCELSLTPSLSTKVCSESSQRFENDYKPRKHYRDYSLWKKILIMFGVTKYTTPDEKHTPLSYKEFSDTSQS
uniref:Fgf-1 n=1 Tax=Cryptophlebia leucotreta granulosis virus TaxID=35254 RepID=A0A2H4ZKC7_GVCL|nr:fgf-1 [Cryptophlebia leucotreta granulovirus]